ncbi:hypothetical protein KGM_212573 [Danaus plexippus plexippus]|uniref:Uncharacterized protein n=1 Tax=Danaus plexippus plexippus TaxID=278856 RepID=A0A212EIB4_DANPL|nr:hypothetical protein KGM_212573 [Danaus plexippus plexippus]
MAVRLLNFLNSCTLLPTHFIQYPVTAYKDQHGMECELRAETKSLLQPEYAGSRTHDSRKARSLLLNNVNMDSKIAIIPETQTVEGVICPFIYGYPSRVSPASTGVARSSILETKQLSLTIYLLQTHVQLKETKSAGNRYAYIFAPVRSLPTSESEL